MVDAFGWRATLLVLAVFGAVTLMHVALRLPETVPRRDPEATRPARVLRNWAEVVGHPTFRAWALLGACTFGGLFCLLASSSFVFIRMLGVSRVEYGLILGSVSLAYICGTFWCRRLLLRHGLRGAVRRGAAFSLAGGASMALLSLAGVHTVWAILVPQYLFAIGHGVHQPCGQAGAVGPFPQKAGTAASLSGFAMTLGALCVGVFLGLTLDSSVYPLTLGIGALSVALAAVAWTLVQRHGEPARAVAPLAGTQPA
jgi:DHA1 family bicyclomycin/chloramphenicol resistance-like MFS transporter